MLRIKVIYIRELKVCTVRNSNDCLFCELHKFMLINLAKCQSLLPCTLVRIAGCPTPNALLRITECPTPKALLRIAGCPTLKALLRISVPASYRYYTEPGSI